MKKHHFHTKLPYQKSILRQTEWWLQNGPITKNGVLPVTTLFSWKFCVSLRTSYKELICRNNNPNAHICTFYKRWSFMWRSFFPVSILKDIMMENFAALFKNVTLLLSTVKALIWAQLPAKVARTNNEIIIQEIVRTFGTFFSLKKVPSSNYWCQ